MADTQESYEKKINNIQSAADKRVKAAEQKAEKATEVAQASADNRVAKAEKVVAETTDKLIAQGKHLDAARAEIETLNATVEDLAAQLDAAQARVAVEHGAAFEVKLVRPAPFNGKSLPVGTIIGTITPLKGETTDYIVDAVRGNYAKCVACEVAEDGDAAEETGGNAGGGGQS